MTVIVLTNCPQGLRGYLTRWLLEISAGVFVGNPSARVRDELWAEVRKYSGKGRALLTHTTDNEQGFTFRTHEHHWEPVDREGLVLIHKPKRKPSRGQPSSDGPPRPRTGWSKAAKRRKFGNR